MTSMSIHPPGEARSRYDLYYTQTLLVWTNIPLQSRGFCNKNYPIVASLFRSIS